MHRVFQRFIDNLSSAEDAVAFSEAMALVATALDLSCFAYLALPSRLGKKPLVISTYPANWVAHYVRNHYEGLDPVILQALQTTEPFQWGLGFSQTRLSSTQKELFDEASQFGIRFGFTVPIHDGHTPVATLTFACDRRNVPFEHCVAANARVLQLMAMYFHAHACRKLMSESRVEVTSLSPREFECLEWASQGKSSWEIGHILGISRYTAASYLNNAKQKLGVRTIVQAAARLAAAKK
jgi:DNA-binding CsgD family transcriptional regulator